MQLYCNDIQQQVTLALCTKSERLCANVSRPASLTVPQCNPMRKATHPMSKRRLAAPYGAARCRAATQGTGSGVKGPLELAACCNFSSLFHPFNLYLYTPETLCGSGLRQSGTWTARCVAGNDVIEGEVAGNRDGDRPTHESVSYTHLTLPTILRV